MASSSTAITPGPKSRSAGTRPLLADLGVDPERFRTEFIYDIFVKQVIVGRMSLLEALDRTLPGLGYRGPSMAFAGYWLSHDSQVNQDLLDIVARIKATGTRTLPCHQPGTHAGAVAVADTGISPSCSTTCSIQPG